MWITIIGIIIQLIIQILGWLNGGGVPGPLQRAALSKLLGHMSNLAMKLGSMGITPDMTAPVATPAGDPMGSV